MDKQLTVKQEKLMSGILAGMSISDAAEEAGVSVSYAHNLHAGTEKPYFKAELDRRRQEQTQRLLIDEPDRSKGALLAELEEIAEHCRQGKPILDKEGEIADYDRDHANWIKTVVERGKLLGYYVDKKEISGKLTVADIMGSVDLDDEEE